MTSFTGATAALVFRPMTRGDADFRLFLETFVANGSPRTDALLRWQYLAPPPDRIFADLAVSEAGGSLAAIYAVFPLQMKLGDGCVLGVQSLDTLTDSKYRGRGLFVRLASALYERLEREEVALVYGFPNANSAHGIFARLGWSSLGRVPTLIRPLRTGYALERLGVPPSASRFFDFPLHRVGEPRLAPGQELRVVERPDAPFSEVWKSFSAGISVAVDRSAEYLRWRLQRPGEEYRTLGLYERERLIGYVVFGWNGSRGRVTGKVMDLIYDPERQDAGRLLIREALRRLADCGAGAVWAWSLGHSPNRRVFRAAGFVRVPQRLHPMEAHFGARGFTDASRALIGEKRNWYISLFDLDTE